MFKLCVKLTDSFKFFDHFFLFRILESYDAFLIGLPREMKCDDYQIQRPTANLNARPNIQANRQLSIEPPAKRKCIENNSEYGASSYTVNGDSAKSNQFAVIGKRSTVRLSKSMSKIGSQISIQKVASMQSASVTTPSTSAATATAKTANPFEIKKVQSLHHHPVSSVEENRVIPASKIPGRRMKKVLITSTPIPTGQVNAQAMPHNHTTVKKLNLVPQDPLEIDTTTTQLTIEPSINAENLHPAFVQEIDVLPTTNKRLSISLPMASTSTSTTTPTTPQPNGIVTRSRINLEHPKPLYKCDSCAFTSEVEQNLMRHNLTVHTGKKPQLCEACKKRFPSKSLLLAHKREYHRELHSDLAYWDNN